MKPNDEIRPSDPPGSNPKSRPEYLVVHNVALGAACLTTFAQAYFARNEQSSGPSLPLMLLILPICFHERSTQKISRLQSAGGLLRALQQMPELPVGLQERVERQFDISLQSLTIATSTGLLRRDMDEDWPQFIPSSKTLPSAMQSDSDDVKTMLAAAKRLGWWFAGDNLVTICNRLNVRF